MIDQNLMNSILTVFGVLQLALHVLFAGAVAQDAGEIAKKLGKPILVSPLTWAFATLFGGVTVAAIYWFLHHSKLTRLGE